MAYQALYRKFRPAEFDQVKGQEHIVKTLQNQIDNDFLSHAYLFTGTRGTGKTTIAKIFAKAVNCENPDHGSPCGQCAMCKAIASGASMNVIEIDAASNNGVDNIREIIDEVSYPPTEGKYKVYIIDEVHMLSAGAYNALLKTLEEPPSYVIFILATTEVHKIPITIASRCQRYDFRRIDIATISKRLRELCDIEGVTVEDKALEYVAKAADGSMRDALSLLDRCIAFYIGQNLTYDNVLSVLGAVDTEVFSKLLRNIIAGDVPAVMQQVEDVVIAGRELGQFVTDFVWYLRNLMLLQSSDDMADVLELSSDNIALLKEEASMVETEVILRYIRILSDLANQLKFTSQKRVLLEVALIKLCRPAMESDNASIIQRLDQLENSIQEGVVVNQVVTTTGAANNSQASLAQVNVPVATGTDIDEIIANWQAIAGAVGQPYTGSLLKAKPKKRGESEIVIEYNGSDNFLDTCIKDEGVARKLQDSIIKICGKQANITPVNSSAAGTSQSSDDVTDALMKIGLDNIATENN